MTERAQPRRPTFLGPVALGAQPGGLDPAEKDAAAHTTARLLVEGAQTAQDAEVLHRLVTLADTEGVEVLARMWSGAAHDSLPGALWRLYVLRTWVHRNPHAAAGQFDAGRRAAPVLEAVAGVAEPPGPDEVRALTDAILAGAYTGDFGVALERAAAFARIVAVGRSHDVDAEAESAARLVTLGQQLEDAAAHWRLGELH